MIWTRTTYQWLITIIVKRFGKPGWFHNHYIVRSCLCIGLVHYKKNWQWPMGLLPDTSNCGCACAGKAMDVFPATSGMRFRHASRHVRATCAVMHAGIDNKRFLLKSAAWENVCGIPGACATHNFTYLAMTHTYSSMHFDFVKLTSGAPFTHTYHPNQHIEWINIWKWECVSS